ncbi:MAG: hypothetical protein NPINA01_06360 [Nitrospinaceae bacterium]|nr:MAG: hypothetical protein NPINA01_06360 [Nitrospinaceae bacterium]
MKKVIISAFAVSLFTLPMTLHAGPGKTDVEKSTAMKPLSAMKSSTTSPSQSSPAAASKITDSAAKTSGKASGLGTNPDSTLKLLEEAEKAGKKKGSEKK